MGMFFSNLHIRKTDTLQQKEIRDYFVQMMKKEGYELVSSQDEAEGILCIYSPAESKWISVCSDIVELDQARDFKEIAVPLSKEMETDILALSCCDSDFLFMNLVNEKENLDAWANVGRLECPPERKTNFSAWERKVSNIFAFQKIVKGDHVFVEDALYEMEELLELSGAQACLSDVSVNETSDQENIVQLCFAMPDDGKKEPPQLSLFMSSLLPCRENQLVRAYNVGSASKGVAIAFVGDYVEQDEITFSDVYLEWNFGRDERKREPVTLTKCQTVKGEWMYYWEDKDFPIPPKVNPGLSVMRDFDMTDKRSFGVRFTPKGNQRKFLDIRVCLIPLANLQGQCCWYVWMNHPSKAAYIEDHNANCFGDKIDPEDYDL